MVVGYLITGILFLCSALALCLMCAHTQLHVGPICDADSFALAADFECAYMIVHLTPTFMLVLHSCKCLTCVLRVCVCVHVCENTCTQICLTSKIANTDITVVLCFLVKNHSTHSTCTRDMTLTCRRKTTQATKVG